MLPHPYAFDLLPLPPQLTMYEAPQPWGPWSLFFRDDDSVHQGACVRCSVERRICVRVAPAPVAPLPAPGRSPRHVHANLPRLLPPPRLGRQRDDGHVLLVPRRRADVPLHAQLAGRHARAQCQRGIMNLPSRAAVPEVTMTQLRQATVSLANFLDACKPTHGDWWAGISFLCISQV